MRQIPTGPSKLICIEVEIAELIRANLHENYPVTTVLKRRNRENIKFVWLRPLKTESCGWKGWIKPSCYILAMTGRLYPLLECRMGVSSSKRGKSSIRFLPFLFRSFTCLLLRHIDKVYTLFESYSETSNLNFLFFSFAHLRVPFKCRSCLWKRALLTWNSYRIETWNSMSHNGNSKYRHGWRRWIESLFRTITLDPSSLNLIIWTRRGRNVDGEKGN